MIPFIRSDLVEIGHSYIGRWNHIIDVYLELGLIPEGTNFKIDEMIYKPGKQSDYSWLWWVFQFVD